LISVADNGLARSGTSRATAMAAEFANQKWLEGSPRPLEWNFPGSRPFSRFRDEDLDTPIIAHFGRVAHRHPNRIAVTDSDTSLSFSELWNSLSGLAELIAAETRPGDLIGIALPTCSLFPLAILACLAAGRPFVALSRRLVRPGVR
jgi:non-ribosomal peptide synthetase component F